MGLASGATFAGFTIVRMLGFGAMGEVYLAQRVGVTRYDALKVLPAAMTADAGFRERFTREAETATTLHHPHIVDAHERGEFDGRLWTAMDYVDGPSAAAAVAERYPTGMPVGEALGIVAAVAEALDYAHRRGILHRGVKPGNIMLTHDGERRALVADFGLARNRTDYSAPEYSGGAIDERADQYGLAATACYLLTGAPPDRQAAGTLSQRRPELAPLEDVMGVGLAANPADRFGRCADFAAALSERARGWTGAYSPAPDVVDYPDDTEPQAEPAPARRRPPFLLAAAAAAVLLLVGLAVGIVVGRKADTPVTSAANPPPSFPAPPAIPTSSLPATPAPDELLDGTYQVDVNRAQQTFNETPAPQPPNVSTWWAFRSSCTPTGCVANGIQLDDNDHRQVRAEAGRLVLDFHGGTWLSRPETLKFPCVGPSGAAANETTTQVLSLQPQAHGPMHGVMVVTVATDECGQQGGKIEIPAVAGRIGAVPPGVTVPR